MSIKLNSLLASIFAFSIISCNPTAPTESAPSIAYTTASATYVASIAITSSNPTIDTTGIIDSFTISPDLHAQTGLTFGKSTGSISGTPTTVHAATAYVVTAHGPGGTDTAILNIKVTDISTSLKAYTWLLTGFTATPAMSLVGPSSPKHVDVYDSGFTSHCQKHLTQKYLANGKVVSSFDSAATASGCGLPDTSTTWSLNGKVVTTTDADLYVEKDTILSISATKLIESVAISSADSPDDAKHTLRLTSTAK